MSIVEDEVCDATEAKCFATAGPKKSIQRALLPFFVLRCVSFVMLLP